MDLKSRAELAERIKQLALLLAEAAASCSCFIPCLSISRCKLSPSMLIYKAYNYCYKKTKS